MCGGFEEEGNRRARWMQPRRRRSHLLTRRWAIHRAGFDAVQANRLSAPLGKPKGWQAKGLAGQRAGRPKGWQRCAQQRTAAHSAAAGFFVDCAVAKCVGEEPLLLLTFAPPPILLRLQSQAGELDAAFASWSMSFGVVFWTEASRLSARANFQANMAKVLQVNLDESVPYW
eukprot:354195-Chlamydomonas_euryale.AAC.5